MHFQVPYLWLAGNEGMYKNMGKYYHGSYRVQGLGCRNGKERGNYYHGFRVEGLEGNGKHGNYYKGVI